MKLHPRLSRSAVELVTRFETFQPRARQAAGGGWTIGYGHTLSAREGAEVSRADAEALLLFDLHAAAEVVEAALFAPVNARQFEAFTAFCFNIGAANFRSSSALARFNAGAELDAADEIERWRRAELGAGTQVVDALVRRRAAEKAHFLGLPDGASKWPSAVLRPLAAEPASTPPPPAARPSRTLDAANDIQARLRELVPEPPEAEAPPFPEEPHIEAQAPAAEPAPPSPAEDEIALNDPARPQPIAPELVEPDLVAPEPAVREPAAAEPSAMEPVAPALAVASEAASAPPLLPIAHPSALPPPTPYAPPPPPPPTMGLAAANDLAEPPAPTDLPSMAQAAPAPPRFRRPSERLMYAVLAGLGACLVVLAAVLILGGRSDLQSLLLGVVGVLMLTPAVYGLLGPARRPPPEPDPGA